MTKYASFEVSEILDVKGSATRLKTASLSKCADFEDYRTEDGYLYARIRAISSRVNKNHDGWPSVELAGGPEIFDRHQAHTGGFTVEASKDAEFGFSTFLGKPIFVDHNNHDPSRARGVIVDSKLHVEDTRTASTLDPYYASAPSNHTPPTWVELLLEVDAKSFPRLAKAIVEGAKDGSRGIDGFSMGCNVEMSKCSHCGNEATAPDEYCQHIRAKGAHFDHVDEHGRKTSRRSYEDCYGIRFFEISAVFDPADETALTREVRSSVRHEADVFDDTNRKNRTRDFGSRPRYEQWEVNIGNATPEDVSGWMAQWISKNITDPEDGVPFQVLGGQGGYSTYTEPSVTLRLYKTDPARLKQILSDYGADHPHEESFAVIPEGERSELWKNPAYQGAPGGTSPEDLALLQGGNAGAEGTTLSSQVLAQHADVDGVDPAGELPSAVGYGSRANLDGDPAQSGGPASEQMNQWLDDLIAHDHGSVADASGGHMARTAAGQMETGDNPLPQSDLIRSPEPVNTLRDESICPVCGEVMDEEECPLCHHIKEPDGMGNPDLTKAQDQDLRNNPVPPEVPLDQTELQDKTVPQPAMPNVPPRNPASLSHVTGDMATWTVLPQRTAGRINTTERPIRPGSSASTSEPTEQVISDQTTPVTSSVRTAADFIAAAGRHQGESMKTADAASGAPEVATPDQRVDVTGIGGVADASNEQASKADAQVSVDGMGGTGVENVESDHESLDGMDGGDNAGFDTTKTTEDSGPTKTFGDGSSAVERQADPVGGDVYPSSDQGVKKSYDSSAYPSEDGGLGGGAAKPGNKPVAEQFGERVNLMDAVTSPDNNSGATKTWSGTDGNGVNKQQDPVTSESIAAEGFGKGSSAHLFAAFKLADLEVELGLTSAERKFARVSELEAQDPSVVIASLDYAKRVKTAGLSRGGAAKTAKRLPVMGRAASVSHESGAGSDESFADDASLFL